VILADAHFHLFRTGFPGIYGRPLIANEIEVYEAFRLKHGIAAGLVVGYEGEGIDSGNNAYIRELAATRPWMTTVAYVEAKSSPTPESVSALMDAGHAGLAVYATENESAKALSRWSPAIWRALAARRALLSFNIGLEQVNRLAPIAAGNPECTFLISHMGMPVALAAVPDEASAKARLAPLLALSETTNVAVKLSGFYAATDPSFGYPHAPAVPLVRVLLERFGRERCVWGSDFSPALDYVSFAQAGVVPGLDGYDEQTRADVMGGNLLRMIAARTKS
jgi:L-fuconolactonase